MRPHVLAPIGALVLFLAAGCGDGEDEGGTRQGTEPARTEPARTEPQQAQRQLDFSRVETVAEGLEVPWALAFGDENTILVTEKPGRVRLIEDGRLREEPIAELDVVAEGEAGLLGIALHPDFPEERFAYLYYTAPDGNRVSRFRIGEDFRLGGEKRLLEGIPAGAVHDGGRISFGPDGLLYVTTGESGDPDLAADESSLGGKFLRIRPDGGVPSDNPFGDSPVFSYGHRNSQGFDWDSEGTLYASEHGPSGELGLCCHDEVNVVEAGKFYGWPFRAGRVAAAEGSPPEEPVEPIAASGADTTWAPAGLAVHEPKGAPKSLFVANLAGEQLLRFVLTDAREVAEVEVALDGLGRLRAARFGPDDCLYLMTSNTDQYGQPRDDDDRVVRVCPAQ